MYLQVKAIVKNRTCIEDWILEKALHRRRNTNEVFKFPYDLGAWNNINEVVSFSCHPVGNGITYKVAEGCDQYTLTVSISLKTLTLKGQKIVDGCIVTVEMIN